MLTNLVSTSIELGTVPNASITIEAPRGRRGLPRDDRWLGHLRRNVIALPSSRNCRALVVATLSTRLAGQQSQEGTASTPRVCVLQGSSKQTLFWPTPLLPRPSLLFSTLFSAGPLLSVFVRSFASSLVVQLHPRRAAHHLGLRQDCLASLEARPIAGLPCLCLPLPRCSPPSPFPSPYDTPSPSLGLSVLNPSSSVSGISHEAPIPGACQTALARDHLVARLGGREGPFGDMLVVQSMKSSSTPSGGHVEKTTAKFPALGWRLICAHPPWR